METMSVEKATRTGRIRPTIGIVSGIVMAACCAVGPAVFAGEGASVYHQIAVYEPGKERKALTALESTVGTAAPEQLLGIEKRLLDVLASPGTTVYGKQFVCRLLRRIGSAQAVPVLAGLLEDKELAHMARFALQHLGAPQADDALLAALSSAKGDLRLGVVGSLGERGCGKAVSALKELAGANDTVLAAAALRALGRIGGSEAAQALAGARVERELRAVKADALLLCADSLLVAGKGEEAESMYKGLTGRSNPSPIRVAAYRGLLTAQGSKAVPTVVGLLADREPQLRQVARAMVTDLPGAEATAAFAAALGEAASETQGVLLDALTSRGDTAAGPAVVALAARTDETVRAAAIRALATIGDATAVPFLAATVAAGGDAGKFAADSLNRMRAAGVDTALMTAAKGSDARIRTVAYAALGARAGQQALPELVALVVTNPHPTDTTALGAMLDAVTRRIREPDAGAAAMVTGLKVADPETKVVLLGLLPQLACAKGLEAVRQSLSTTDKTVGKAAFAALAAWPTAEPFPDLLAAARKKTAGEDRDEAFRACLRMLSLLKEDPAARTKTEAVMALAHGQKEQALVLDAVAGAPSLWALEFVEQYQKKKALKDAADDAHAVIMAALNKMVVIGAAGGREGVLVAKEAKIHGGGASYEAGASRDCIGNWNNVGAWVSWKILVRRPGKYAVMVAQSMVGAAGSTYAVTVAEEKVEGTVVDTGDWARFKAVELGTVSIDEAGTYTVTVKPLKKPGDFVMNLRSVTLRPVTGESKK